MAWLTTMTMTKMMMKSHFSWCHRPALLSRTLRLHKAVAALCKKASPLAVSAFFSDMISSLSCICHIATTIYHQIKQNENMDITAVSFLKYTQLSKFSYHTNIAIILSLFPSPQCQGWWHLPSRAGAPPIPTATSLILTTSLLSPGRTLPGSTAILSSCSFSLSFPQFRLLCSVGQWEGISGESRPPTSTVIRLVAVSTIGAMWQTRFTMDSRMYLHLENSMCQSCWQIELLTW